MSLEARRANHDFLSRPIAKQALLVVVPEYDRVAPVLAKPVCAGLFSLAQGSLLQNYDLAVGIGRLSVDPVGYAAAARGGDLLVIAVAVRFSGIAPSP
ncbi:MAG: hypothetical protein R3D70_22865 [Rhizobiaceae bacterium]